MAAPCAPDPVKLLVAALWSTRETLDRALQAMVALWGPIDHEGRDYSFDVTGYYDDEMGGSLWRRFITFHDLVPPAALVEVKLATNRIEDSLRDDDGHRLVNLDAGYLDHHKLVLASAKAAGQKIYLDQGIYADMMFRCAKGRLIPFEWTFPDFRDGRYDCELLDVRRNYLEQLRRQRADTRRIGS